MVPYLLEMMHSQLGEGAFHKKIKNPVTWIFTFNTYGIFCSLSKFHSEYWVTKRWHLFGDYCRHHIWKVHCKFPMYTVFDRPFSWTLIKNWHSILQSPMHLPVDRIQNGSPTVLSQEDQENSLEMYLVDIGCGFELHTFPYFSSQLHPCSSDLGRRYNETTSSFNIDVFAVLPVFRLLSSYNLTKGFPFCFSSCLHSGTFWLSETVEGHVLTCESHLLGRIHPDICGFSLRPQSVSTFFLQFNIKWWKETLLFQISRPGSGDHRVSSYV